MLFFLLPGTVPGQRGLYINGAEASFRVDTAAFVSVDGDFANTDCDPVMQVRFNGELYLSGNFINHDSLKFAGSTNSSAGRARLCLRTTPTFTPGQNIQLSGSVVPRLWSLVLDKPGGNVTLMTDVRCSDTVEFKSGRILMNGHDWELIEPVGAVSVLNHPWIKNESNSSRFTGTSLGDTGTVIYKTIYSSMTDINPANIGILLNGPVDYGSSVYFERGFTAQQSGKSGAGTYFTVRSPAYGLQNTTVTVRYYASDGQYYSSLNQFQITQVKPYVSADADLPWTQLSISASSGQVSGGVPQGFFSMPMSQLAHPNIAVTGTALRFTVADPLCFIKPASALNYDTLGLCTGKSFTMDAGNLPGAPGTALKWEWNSSPPSYQQTVSVQAGPVSKRMRVQITDVRGCITKDSVFMPPATPGPVISYLNHLNACTGDSVTIKDTVKMIGGSHSLTWVFSDGSSSKTGANSFKKKFSSVGQHSLHLTVNSQYGCKATATISNIMVYPLPTASFTQSYDCSNHLTTFSNTSVSNYSAHVTTPHWFFAGAKTDTSTLDFPLVNYELPGSYKVFLRATTSFGCRDSIMNFVTIHPRNQPSFQSNNVCFGVPVTFTNLSVCNTGSCSYEWVSTGGTLGKSFDERVTFGAPGGYGMKLRVSAPVGCPDSVTAPVFVHPVPHVQFVLSSPSLCVSQPLYLSNSSSISAGSISSYSWDLGGANSSTLTNVTTNYPVPGNFEIALTVVSDSGCVASDTAQFVSLARPVSGFLADNVCHGEVTSFTGTSVGNGLSHTWLLTGSTTKASGADNHFGYTYGLPGTYQASLVVTDMNGCSDTSEKKVIVRAVPLVNLGSNISTCGNSYTLDAQNPDFQCVWWPGNIHSPCLVATKDGKYTVKVTAPNGCEAASVVSLTLHGVVQPQLGSDLQVCGHTILDAGYPGCSYLWNNGETSQTKEVTSSGTFAVHVTDLNQCSGSDTIVVTVLDPPIVNAGSDTVLCNSAMGLLLNCSGNAPYYLWNTGVSGASAPVSVSGYYWVDATGSNGCKASDTVMVSFLRTPTVELGADLASCKPVVLDAKNAGCSFLWSDGDTRQWRDVSASGWYSVVASDTLTGCLASDSVKITIHPAVVVQLGSDTTFCSGQPIVLNAGNSGSFFSWVDGSQSQSVSVSGSGFYGVVVTDMNGCSGSDYINVGMVQSPTVDLGAPVRFICGETPVLLQSTFSEGNVWATSYGEIGRGKSVEVEATGKVWLTVYKGACLAADTVMVEFTTHTIQAMFLASTIDTVNRPVKFINLSEPDPVTQTWFFGDGMTSNAYSPIHTYELPTDFSVTLEVSNGFCTDRITKALSVLFRETGEETVPLAVKLELIKMQVFPNPFSNESHLEVELNEFSQVTLQLTDVYGQTLYSENQEGKLFSRRLSLSQEPNGVYFLTLQAGGPKGTLRKTLRIVKTN